MLGPARSLSRGPRWGWTVAGGRETHVTTRLDVVVSSWLLWVLDATSGRATESRGFARLLAPFLGVIGLTPAEDGEHSTIPPRATVAGNIDCREFVAGFSLYLPGGGHAAQATARSAEPRSSVRCGLP